MGGLWLSSQGRYVNENGQESELDPAMGLKQKPPRNRAVVPLHWALIGVTGRSGPTDRTLLLSVRSPDSGHVSSVYNSVRQIPTVEMLTGHSDRVDQTLDPQRPVVYSKGPNPIFADQTRPVMLDRTQPSVRCLTLSAMQTNHLTGRSPSVSSHRATQRPVNRPTPASHYYT